MKISSSFPFCENYHLKMKKFQEKKGEAITFEKESHKNVKLSQKKKLSDCNMKLSNSYMIIFTFLRDNTSCLKSVEDFERHEISYKLEDVLAVMIPYFKLWQSRSMCHTAVQWAVHLDRPVQCLS